MLSKKLTGTIGAGIAALGIAAPGASAQIPPAATFTVVSAASSGPGTLRAAINSANLTASEDTIEFAIPGGGVHVISLTSGLPIISQPVHIDGFSQTNADPAADIATTATPKIVIDASNVPRGIDIGGNGIEIRGLVVRSAQSTGIYVEGHDNVIAGNHIGTDADGAAGRPNGQFGVQVVGPDNVIGGPAPEDRNVISSNPYEVAVIAGADNLIEGNRIGTNAAGTAGIGGFIGVRLESDGTVVRGNLIGDEMYGLFVESDDNTVQGNKIGTGRLGAAAIPNSYGVLVSGGDGNQLGGTEDGEGNLVSGNSFAGIELAADADGPAEENVLEGNLVGTDASGTVALANGGVGLWPGVMVSASSDNTIGGAEPGAGNVISGNAANGIGIIGVGADRNEVLANWIGTDRGGTLDLGNGQSGVRITDGEQNHIGDAPRLGNTIAHNGGDGVTVVSGSGNSIRKNSIHHNGTLGIDLGADGPTANDPLDADSGANQLQNGPEVESATTTEVVWSLKSVPDTWYRLEFYENDSCDRSGSGEAQTYLDTLDVHTDANGNVDDGTPLTVGAGKLVTMTATRLTGQGGATRSTSELSPCEEVDVS